MLRSTGRVVVEPPRSVVRAFLGLLLLVVWSVTCRAQQWDGPVAGPARELWLEGKQLSAVGDFEGAVDRFERAYDVEPTPLLGLWVARTLARAGRLLEASDRYRALSQQNLPSDATARDWSAKKEAESERRALLPRIPSVVVGLDGAAREEVSVTVNGQAVAPNAIGVPRNVDPGWVRVCGSRGELQVETRVHVGEGELKVVRLSFARPTPLENASSVSTRGRTGATEGRSETERSAPARIGDGRRLLGYVSMGVGGAALLTGAVFGTLALDDESRLRNECPRARCRSALSSDVEAYESRKTVATVGLVAGALLTTTGLVLYLTAPRDSRSARVGVRWLGSSAGRGGAVFLGGAF